MLFPLAFFTFFYTAPKIPHPFFAPLRGFAFAKTLYLSSVWLCVTVFLPLYQAQIPFSQEHWLFAFNRFLIIFGVSMIFDFRDRNEDFGIKNWITYFDEKQLSVALYFIAICFIVSTLYWKSKVETIAFFAFILPMLLLVATLHISKQTNNDYWFYVFLDGVVLLSGVGLWIG
jgi:heme/copper-type cytochrome/quinol oxidase subunit 4